MRSLIASFCLFACAGAAAAPIAYTLDPAHTQVRFSWSHLQYSNPEAAFDDVSGTLMWDGDDVTRSSVRVSMAVGSVHSHVTLLDEKLKSPEFLDAATFPQATFVSTRVERVDDRGQLRIQGELTIHGITRPVALQAHLNRTGIYPMLELPAAGFSATAVIRRSEFGVGAGIPNVGDELEVHITTEALEAAGYAKVMKEMATKSAANAKS